MEIVARNASRTPPAGAGGPEGAPPGCASFRTSPCAEPDASAAPVPSAPDLRGILYAQSWEDPDVDRRALGIGAGDDVLAIAASGDNALAFLLDGPRSLTALDGNAAQCALLELKMAAIDRATRGELLELAGVRPSRHRDAIYRRLRPALPERSRRFWDGHPDLIARGLVHAGRFERYFEFFRRFVLPWVHSRRTCDTLLACASLAEQRAFYRDRWDGVRWRAMFRIFFSRTVMRRLGRHPATFRYVDGGVASVLRERVRYGLTEIPVASNRFLEYILRGGWAEAVRRPPWLLEENQPRLRALLARVTVVHAGLEDFLAGARSSSFDKFCLSDVFEYVDEEAAARMFGELTRVGREGAVTSYREMMVPRPVPESLRRLLVEDAELGIRGHRQERAFFYGAHRVLIVRRPDANRGGVTRCGA